MNNRYVKLSKVKTELQLTTKVIIYKFQEIPSQVLNFQNLSVKKRTKQIYILLIFATLTLCILKRTELYSQEARNFRRNLQIANVLERTTTCSKYMRALRDVIFPQENST